MAKPIVITAENFSKVLSSAVSADKSLRSQVQRLIEFGLTEYDTNHNSNYLTELIVADFHGIRTQAVQDYIEKYTDLVLTKFDDGAVRFKREATDGYEFEMPTITWWEDSKAGQAIAKEIAKLEAAFLGQVQRLVDGKGKHKLVEGDETEASRYLEHLKAYVPLTPAEIAALKAGDPATETAQA